MSTFFKHLRSIKFKYYVKQKQTMLFMLLKRGEK